MLGCLWTSIRGKTVDVPVRWEITAAPQEILQGAWAGVHVNRNWPPVVDPAGEPSAVEKRAKRAGRAPPRLTKISATPYSALGVVPATGQSASLNGFCPAAHWLPTRTFRSSMDSAGPLCCGHALTYSFWAVAPERALFDPEALAVTNVFTATRLATLAATPINIPTLGWNNDMTASKDGTRRSTARGTTRSRSGKGRA